MSLIINAKIMGVKKAISFVNVIMICIASNFTVLSAGDVTPNSSSPSSVRSHFRRLFTSLMKDYEPRVRPSINASGPVEVGIYASVFHIVEVMENTNTIMASASLEMWWQDDFLRWDPAEFGNITEMFFPHDTIWTPEISLYYGVVSDPLLEKHVDARVNYTGGVRHHVPFVAQVVCAIDVKYFPFDEQQCGFFFGSWAYDAQHLHWKLLTHTAYMEDFYDNQEWILLGAALSEALVLYEFVGGEHNYSTFTLTLDIRRQSFYYIFNLVIPSALVAAVAVIGLHRPTTPQQTRDAKFQLGIVTILALTTMLLSIAENMPKFSPTRQEGLARRKPFSSVPLIAIYYTSLLLIIISATLTSSLLVTLERAVRNKTLPRKLLWLFEQKKLQMKGQNTGHKCQILNTSDTDGSRCHFSEQKRFKKYRNTEINSMNTQMSNSDKLFEMDVRLVDNGVSLPTHQRVWKPQHWSTSSVARLQLSPQPPALCSEPLILSPQSSPELRRESTLSSNPRIPQLAHANPAGSQSLKRQPSSSHSPHPHSQPSLPALQAPSQAPHTPQTQSQSTSPQLAQQIISDQHRLKANSPTLIREPQPVEILSRRDLMLSEILNIIRNIELTVMDFQNRGSKPLPNQPIDLLLQKLTWASLITHLVILSTVLLLFFNPGWY